MVIAEEKEKIKLKIESLEKSLNNIKGKSFKILFFLTESESPSAGVYEIYNHVRLLRSKGYDAQILTDKVDYKVPEWLDDDMKVLPHVSTSTKESFTVSTEDFLVIPEIFSNVMKETMNLPCSRIILLQNFDLAIDSLTPGLSWKHFNINNVMTTSDSLKKLLEDYMGIYDTKVFKIGIPEYFKKPTKPKKLMVTHVTRNPKDANKLFKYFALKNKHYSFITFNAVNGESREEFAEKMAESAFCVWIDKNASFGTVPLEAMKCGTLLIGYPPDIKQDYLTDNSGLWSDNIRDMADMLAQAIHLYLQDGIPQEIYDEMDRISSQYDKTVADESIIENYQYYFTKRENEIDKFYNDFVNTLKQYEEQPVKE